MPTPANIAVYSGLLIGLAYGAIGLLSGFCLLSSLRGWWASGDSRLIRTYALALGVAIAAAQLLAASGVVDLGKSIYLQPSFSAPLMLLGGVLFGYGMVLSNGCGSRALVLLGQGNLRSLVVVLVLGIAAQMTLKGLIAPTRVAVLQWTQIAPSVISLPALLAKFGLGEPIARMIAASAISGALIIFAFAHAPFLRSKGQIAAGLAVGLLVAAGWFATGYLGADDFNPTPVTSLTFIAPIADSVQYVMLSTGLSLNFGITLVAGVIAGSLITALVTGRFHWEGYTSPRHMLRSICGAALMGAGGAMAYGCSIGQGLTGLSTLALASFVAVAGILLGSALGLRGVLRVQPLVPAQDAPLRARELTSPDAARRDSRG
ncbi:YeeE/YedE family protein [Bradyrhizobium sp.]